MQTKLAKLIINKMQNTKPQQQYNSTAFKEGMQRERNANELTEKKDLERKNNPNMHLERYNKKRLPPPLKKEQNKELTQKNKYNGRKEDLTPKQEVQNKNGDAVGKHKPIDRCKQISPLPNSNDYHTVSVSQRNKLNRGDLIPHPVQGASKKQERDTRMRKKISSQQQAPLAAELLRQRMELVKKQASPSQQKQQPKGKMA